MTWLPGLQAGRAAARFYGSHHHTWQALVTNWAVQDGKHTVVETDYDFLKPWYENTLKLQDNGYIQDYSTLKTANIHYISVFKNQQCAMMPMGTWFIATMMQSQAEGETDFRWGVAAIPHPSDTEAGYTVGALTPITSADSATSLSWPGISSSLQHQRKRLTNALDPGRGVVYQEYRQKLPWKQLHPAEFFPEGEGNVEALNYSHYVFDRPLDSKIEEIRTVLNEVHEMIMIHGYSVDDGINELKERVAEIKGW